MNKELSFELLLKRISSDIHTILQEMNVDPQYTVESSREGFGDIMCNVAFLLAKDLKKSPQSIAKILKEKYESKFDDEYILKIIAHDSGYLNFTIDVEKFANIVLKNALNDYYGDEDKNFTIEHTSVNPNKAIHIGHVRNMIIGDTLSRILCKAGNKVSVLNYIDDSGLQVADIVLGFKHLGFSIETRQKFDQYCGDVVYVQTTKKYDQKEELKEKRRQILESLEDLDSEIGKFAIKITRMILEQQLKTCQRLDVTYDCLNFESHILQSGMWKNVFEILKENNIIELEKDGDNKNCWMLKDGDESKVVVRSNGVATYFAKDIPYALWKLGRIKDPFSYTEYSKQDGKILWQTVLKDGLKKDFTSKRVITVIDHRQSYLQKMIIKLINNFDKSSKYIHLGYEAVTLSSDTASQLGIDTFGKQIQMSGRKGLYINADDVLDKLSEKTFSETKKRNPDLNVKELKEISKKLALGALRYEMIKQDLDKKIIFDLTESLSFQGDTASYIQYSYTRATRILEGKTINESKPTSFTQPHERRLIIEISKFSMHVSSASKNLSPKIIAKYSHTLAVTFNAFYEHVRITNIDNIILENSRLYLVKSFQKTLASSLNLLGIPVPCKM